MCCVHIPSAGVSVCAVQTGILSPDSTYSRDPGRPLSATTVLKNRSVFAAVCSKGTGKDRHLLLTTNAGRGGEIQSLMSGWGCLLCLWRRGGTGEGALPPLHSHWEHHLPTVR